MLNGYSAQLAKRKAPAAAENTEKSSGALIPSATVIVAANSRSKSPLKKAVVRVCHPSTSRIPKRVSAQVATMATPLSVRTNRVFPYKLRIWRRSPMRQHSKLHHDSVTGCRGPHLLCSPRVKFEIGGRDETRIRDLLPDRQAF